MKLIVMGHKRHGKDTACEFWRDNFGKTFISSSELACNLFIYEHMKSEHGYTSAQECFADRENHRALWFDLICDYNKDNLMRLGAEIFKSHDIYCGIRNREEFLALKNAGAFDLSIWIDASERLPEESSGSSTITIDDADIVIRNNKDLSSFEQSLSALGRLLFERNK